MDAEQYCVCQHWECPYYTCRFHDLSYFDVKDLDMEDYRYVPIYLPKTWDDAENCIMYLDI